MGPFSRPAADKIKQQYPAFTAVFVSAANVTRDVTIPNLLGGAGHCGYVIFCVRQDHLLGFFSDSESFIRTSAGKIIGRRCSFVGHEQLPSNYQVYRDALLE